MPLLWPKTIPDEEPMVAIAVLPLSHPPPEAGSVNNVVNPVHTVMLPWIGAGTGFTVSTVVALQPVRGIV